MQGLEGSHTKGPSSQEYEFKSRFWSVYIDSLGSLKRVYSYIHIYVLGV